MKKIIENKKRGAQQLVEFLLVAPFMIIILGILTEYAYALNINMTLTQGLKESAANIYYSTKPNMTNASIVAAVNTNLQKYLSDNNVSTDAANEITLTALPLGDTTVFLAHYKYIPAFTLPNMYFRFLPSEFNFVATSAVPTTFLNGNTYGSSTTTSALSNIWSGGSKGVMNSASGRSDIVFLTPVVNHQLNKPYMVQFWDGAVQPYTLDTYDGKLYDCTALCVDSGHIFKDYYTGYSSIIFIHDGGVWSDVLNRALALADSNRLTNGNYDNINVSLYNSGIVSPPSILQPYTVKVVGGKVFTYMTADDISRLYY